jgi:hypothetical protein
MKTHFTKNIIRIYAILFFFINSETSFAQWSQLIDVTGGLQVTSTGGSVAGNNTYSGVLFPTTNNLTTTAQNGWIALAVNNTPPGNRFKATAGKPITLTITIAINNFGEITNFANLPAAIGKNEQNNAYDNYIDIPLKSFNNDPRLYTYERSITFTHARSEAWIVVGFEILIGGNLRPYTMVLPFIVDGIKNPDIPFVTNTNNGQRSVITQPQLPISVLHAPPGDQSYSGFETNKTTCQSITNTISEGLTESGNGSIKLGYSGSAGFIVQVDIEAYVEMKTEGSEGNTTVKINDKETCISSTTGFSTSPGSKEDIYLCEGLDFNYGIYTLLFINPTNFSTYTKDGLALAPIDNSTRLNLYTRTDILEQIELRRLDTLNTSLPLKQRIDAKNQLNVWKQIIELNNTNVSNATVPIIGYGSTPITGNSSSNFEFSVTTTLSNSLSVDNYIENNNGLQAVVNIGGSGFSGGYNLRTTKSYGQTNTSTSSNTTTIKVHLEDDDAGDVLNTAIFRDPMFGTPLFKLLSGGKSSCPYEGGYQRDQPRIEIVGSVQNNITISNVTLGTPASFQIKLCNDSNESRTYDLGFVSQSNSNDLLISAAGSSGSQFGSFTVPANSCRIQNYDVNIARRFPTSDINFSNLELELFPSCEPSIKSSIFANVSFAAPPPATGVATDKTEACLGTPVTLSANCPVSTTPTWYTVSSGGFPVAVGASVTVNPSTNTTYYVGCETVDYKRDRIATKLVLVGSPSSVLNLTSNLTTSSLQMSNTVITATNKIFSPASVIYKAGNSLTFSPGFEAKTGSNFLARIGNCNN